MVTTLKSGSDNEAIRSTWKQLQNQPARRRLNAYKYCGIVQFKEDALTLQKRWRDEWD